MKTSPQIFIPPPRKYPSSLSLKIAWLPWKGQILGPWQKKKRKHKYNSCQTRLLALKSACSEVRTKFREQEESSIEGVTAGHCHARRPVQFSKMLHVHKFKLIITLPNESELCLSVILARIFSRLPKTCAYPNPKTM